MLETTTNTPEGLTSLADWNKDYEEGVEFHFPSGFRAKVRPVNTTTFIRLGRIADLLSPLVSKAISGDINLDNVSLEELTQLYELYDIFCETCIVWPRAVREVKDQQNEILLERIPDLDKVTLFQFMGAPARTLASFRPEQEKPVDNMERKSRHKTSTK